MVFDASIVLNTLFGFAFAEACTNLKLKEKMENVYKKTMLAEVFLTILGMSINFALKILLFFVANIIVFSSIAAMNDKNIYFIDTLKIMLHLVF